MSLERLLENNRNWATGRVKEDPDYFQRLVNQQTPEYLWIGCSDSRVPANQIVGLAPGEVFVHRNIANVVVHTDLNCLSVLQFAVDVLGVKHVIVCGHYGCGGVRAAMEETSHGLIDNWLLHIRDIGEKYAEELAALPGEVERENRMCELNVIEQVRNVAKTTIVKQAWERGQKLELHGIVYGLHDGHLRNLDLQIGSLAEFNRI